MAAALYPPRPDNSPSPTLSPNVQVNVYPRAIMSELDIKDNRYSSPTRTPSSTTRRSSAMLLNPSDLSTRESYANSNEGAQRDRVGDAAASGWSGERGSQRQALIAEPVPLASDLYSQQSQSQQSQQARHESMVSYALPPGAARRVLERYSLDDAVQRVPSKGSADAKPTGIEPMQEVKQGSRRRQQSPAGQNPSQERPTSYIPSTRHPSLPVLGVGAGQTHSPPHSSIVPSSVPLGYNNASLGIPISPKHRAYAQHPTYITPPSAPNPINPVFSPNPPPPQEDVCVECAMRDQDMADVDVTSPGVWERESDVFYDDLRRQEYEEETSGVINGDSSRPKAKGGRLTEQNVKIWLSVNPREPASRQQTLDQYIKSQRTLLEAETLAHARAMQEAKQLDNRMRDTYSQLRRSAYDMGSSAVPVDDTGGVRIKPPRSATSPNPSHARRHSRDVTLLENGMIVEHVDVRKEEKEERERKRKEERRARKSSRGSVMDVTSLYSTHSLAPHTDSGLGLKSYSPYLPTQSTRPTSVLTAPLERPDLLRAYSQASFSDVHSLGSGSPRRSRFFGFKNLSAGWRSQDSLAPSGMSGSMVDMHVALQREAYKGQMTQSPVDIGFSSRRSQIWPPVDPEQSDLQHTSLNQKPKKKKSGFAKIWRIVTGASKTGATDIREMTRSFNEDDLPLAPPPPLSYLVDRGPIELHTSPARNASTPSLPSTTSPRNGLSSPGMSSATPPSSILPSPISLRPASHDVDPATEVQRICTNYGQNGEVDDSDKTIGGGNIYPVRSDSNTRQHVKADTPSALPLSTPRPLPIRPASIMSREKSLPPLPSDSQTHINVTRPEIHPESRPRTYTFDPRPLGLSPAHGFLPPQAAFRAGEVRRQSFSGLTSRPSLPPQPIPSNTSVGQGPRMSLGPRYDDFGQSRQSIARLERVEDVAPMRTTSNASKRRSRFGLASLLGKKAHSQEKEQSREVVHHHFPTLRSSGSDGQDDFMTNGYATSASRHSIFSAGPRVSVTSRKALEELVAQDPDFVAYRYPSNDQRLDLLR